jgi:hypothetical protein
LPRRTPPRPTRRRRHSSKSCRRGRRGRRCRRRGGSVLAARSLNEKIGCATLNTAARWSAPPVMLIRATNAITTTAARPSDLPTA